MFNQKTRRIAVAYLVLQLIIWVKSALFFAWFGHGKSMQFSFYDFPESAIVFDYFFHNAVHFLIAALALLFGASLKKIEWQKLVAIMLAAVALHNAGYWFSATFPSIEYTLFDFTRDSVMLFAFVLAGFILRLLLHRAKKCQSKELNS